ncbi:hypothetical protein [Maribacter sp. 2304DJ31-5]|uniref:hypothetical protein n=1 Tax=Maribacter sp. 2304DJ31-5 TaxID=3386273 RepID=UPI0039BC5C77
MKKRILLFIMVFTMINLAKGQEFNTIPVSSDFDSLQDGWYKFDFQNTYFDVEFKTGRLVKGIIKWADGSSYSGDLSGTGISGKGTYIWSDGSRYEGKFKNHKRHGKGSLINKDGSKWSGKWVNNQKQGKGKVFNASGEVTQVGVWASNELLTETKK